MPEFSERQIDLPAIAAVMCAAASLLVFGVCITMAISLKPGWSFERSFLSELGVSTAASAIWFQAAVCSIAIGVLPLFLNFLRVEGQRRFAALGIISTIALCGIAFTPMDTHLTSHNVCLGLWLVALLAMLVLQCLDGLRSKQYLLVAACWGLGSLVLAYVTGPLRGTAPFYQKLVIGGAIGWLSLIGWLTFRSAYVLVKYRVAKVGHDRKTSAYLKRLEKNGMYGPEGRAAGRGKRA